MLIYIAIAGEHKKVGGIYMESYTFAAEKKRLIESGVDMEYLRLYCRALSKRQNSHAESRLERYKKDHFVSN